MPTPKSRFMGHRNVPKVAKYAIVIYEYTREEHRRYHKADNHLKARATAMKMFRKLIERMKQQPKYDFDPGNTGLLWSYHAEELLKSKEFSDDHMYGYCMTIMNQFAHEVIHEHAQDYDPNSTESETSDPFYKTIYDELVA